MSGVDQGQRGSRFDRKFARMRIPVLYDVVELGRLARSPSFDQNTNLTICTGVR